MIRLLVADDHSIMREGIRAILSMAFPSIIIEEANDADTLLSKAREGNWTAIISDMTMPGKNGIDAARIIKKEFPNIPVLILSMHPEERYAIRALKAGASGYLHKEVAPQELVNALQTIMEGKKYISPYVAERLASEIDLKNPSSPHESLSDRELEVYRLIAEGNSIQSVATKLSVNTTTVSTYRARLLLKMNMKTNAELIRYAVENTLW